MLTHTVYVVCSVCVLKSNRERFWFEHASVLITVAVGITGVVVPSLCVCLFSDTVLPMLCQDGG